MRRPIAVMTVVGGLSALAFASPDAVRDHASARQDPPTPTRQTDVSATLNNPGSHPRIGIQAFSVSGTSPELRAAAETIADVLAADLDFEREFYVISRKASAGVPVASTPQTLPFSRWIDLGADFVMMGSPARGRRQAQRGRAAHQRQERRRRHRGLRPGVCRLHARQSAVLRALDRRRHAPQDAQSGWRRAHAHCLHLGPGRRSRRGTADRRRRPGQRDLHDGLRRRGAAAPHDEPLPQHRARLGTGRAHARLRVGRPRFVGRLRHAARRAAAGAARARKRQCRQLQPGGFPGRDENRVRVESRRADRLLGHLGRESRRVEPAQSDARARSDRAKARLPGTPTAGSSRSRRTEPAPTRSSS